MGKTTRTTRVTEYEDGEIVKETETIVEEETEDVLPWTPIGTPDRPIGVDKWRDRFPHEPWINPNINTPNWDLAQDYLSRCPCNPANGGSGVCNCVNPYNQIWCNSYPASSTSITLPAQVHCQTDGYSVG